MSSTNIAISNKTSKKRALIECTPSDSTNGDIISTDITHSPPVKKRKLADNHSFASNNKSVIKHKSHDLLPVTILSGFLGSGKTTLLKRLLTNTQSLKIAVIVNDMALINIDSQLIKNSTPMEPSNEELYMIELQNGCICCTLREDLLLEIQKIAKQQRFDYLIIESTGIAEPMQIAETFTFSDLPETFSESKSEILSDLVRLDTMVTLLDAKNFDGYLQSIQLLSEKYSINDEKQQSLVPESDDRSVSHLLIDQIEFANVVLINKIDLLMDVKVECIRAIIRKLNKNCKIFETIHANIDCTHILNTGLFSFEEASKSIGWLSEIRGEHISESEEYGISSFVYCNDQRPFHPQRIHHFFQLMTDGGGDARVFRGKGFLWIAHANELVFTFSQCGSIIDINVEGEWDAEINDGDDHHHEQNMIRGQKIVFIGQHLNEKKMKLKLDECLLTDEEFDIGCQKWYEAFADVIPEELQVREEESDDDEDIDV